MQRRLWGTDPLTLLSARLQGLPRPQGPRRVFLVGANPFVLLPKRLEDIAEQAARLDEAGISYSFFYLAGISGAGRGTEGALRACRVNLTHL